MHGRIKVKVILVITMLSYKDILEIGNGELLKLGQLN